MFKVFYRKKIEKSILKMPRREQELLVQLIDDLAASGPVQASWPNYSKLAKNKYHCHLSYRWVACWYETVAGVEIEVYYAGSRKDAPY